MFSTKLELLCGIKVWLKSEISATGYFNLIGIRICWGVIFFYQAIIPKWSAVRKVSF
ncbi:MAG: hypothetical protein FWG98_10505 [Candidatus Cloacimonetes bacterium]|nr:hypothetical protein [Candidatus Cloacimonadota bacterium]